jgi:hypothetical protein
MKLLKWMNDHDVSMKMAMDIAIKDQKRYAINSLTLNAKTGEPLVAAFVVDSSFDDVKPIIKLKDIDIIDPRFCKFKYKSTGENNFPVIPSRSNLIAEDESRRQWSAWEFYKWVDFTDNDGDKHHGKITYFFNPDDPTNPDYVLEVDLFSEE